MNTNAAKSLLSQYDSITQKLAALEEETRALLASRSEVVRSLATAVAPVKRIRHGGQDLTIVVDGGKGKNACFLRGPRTDRTDAVDLDAAE